MAKAAKAYVLGQPFQSHRAAQRMTQAINIHTEQLHKAIRTAIDYLDHMEPDAAEVILLNAVAGCERAEGSDSATPETDDANAD